MCNRALLLFAVKSPCKLPCKRNDISKRFEISNRFKLPSGIMQTCSYGHSVCIFLLLILPKVRWWIYHFWVNFRMNCLIPTVLFIRWRIIWLDYQIRLYSKYDINAPERNGSFIIDWISFKTGFFAGKHVFDLASKSLTVTTKQQKKRVIAESSF